MVKFIRGKPLWVHILVAIALVFILLFLFLWSLGFVTKHGNTLTIPSVNGRSLADAQKILEERGFEIEIQDSVFVDTAAPRSVLRQFPEADAVVKQNRTVYLTISRAVAPTIDMPNLEGVSFRNAEMVLRQYGLRLEDTVFKPDFAKNAVLEQQFNGERIKPGTKIRMGSGIVLILGSGLGQDEFSVPDMFALTFADAKAYLEASGLNLGAPVFDPDVRDSSNAFVYRQSPQRFTEDRRINRIRQGQSVDVWLSVQKPIRQADSTLQQPAPGTPTPNQY
ncbi:MAG: PASTA domain-containing protein [Chitinophagaceae bacterium]|nr:PASTA domain-containing protein [Chitinophagaceae bacterium]